MFARSLSRIFVSAALAFAWQGAMAAGAAEIARDANASLQQLYASAPAAKALGANANAILVFPKVTKAGLGVGGQYRERASCRREEEVGVGPTVVVMDEGKAKTMTTTTAKDDVYAFIFGQKGLMAGLGVQGNKITKINPK